MEFGKLPLHDAEGAILAHSVKHGGGVFKKGRVLSAEDVEALSQADVTDVFAARLGNADVPEDEAADRIARVIGGQGTTAQAPFTGRANLHAMARGVAIVDAERVRAVNRIHESLTLATVPPFAQVDEREMVATVKVIPFAVPREVLEEALGVIGDQPLLRVAVFKGKRAGLVITTLPQTKPSIVAKSEEAIRERIEALDGHLADVRVVGHAIAAVRGAVEELSAEGCDPLLLFGASAIVDRGDVIPAALAEAGGEVIHLGMPVDPGNLMMLGRLGEVPVIGVPSCARSPKLNGFDWVLARVMAGESVSAQDIMDMGAGGLLAEIPTRPSPREGKPKVQRAPRVAGVVLAAGLSSRMGANKLLADIGGVPMIRRTVEALVPAGLASLTIVTGRDADEVEKALAGLPVTFTHNARFASGLASSLARGIASVPDTSDAVLVCLGDMPRVDAQAVAKLVAAFNPAEHRSICVPVFKGQRGNPVLWGRQHFLALMMIDGDRGGRALMDQLHDDLVEIEMPDSAVVTDADTPEALARLRAGLSA
ncbi:NTP transferase domain-containing protein [Aestuariivirga sp.]|uniref:NTP transferase domain-containing protein n=1 Tax=Aestuariivirga sp. TaxID=2650926 RepID=UPI0039E44791